MKCSRKQRKRYLLSTKNSIFKKLKRRMEKPRKRSESIGRTSSQKRRRRLREQPRNARLNV